MADNQTTVALNIGSQRIGMAVFEAAKNGGLLLKAYDSESIAADPGADALRAAQARAAISDLVQRLKVGKSKVRYAISGQSVITRFVKLPPLQEDNIEQLVSFEAQQHVPWPINEVVWDYELLESAGEKEVAVVAIKSESLDEINRAVNDAGLVTAEVDVAPMALYNAFYATYGKVDEPVLLIDIGSKNSNLLYIEGGRFFTRSINVGGATVTNAISKEYNVGFAEAEHHKMSSGLVALGGGHTEQLDESVAALAMVIRNALTRLPSEISRTTNYYRSQHGGNAPRRVFICGGGATLPYTREFFEEKLHLPVEVFNPLQNVAVGKGVDPDRLQKEGHLMGELVGLGLRGIGKSKINIDLVPATVEQARASERRKPFLVGAAAIILAGAAAYAGLQYVAAGKASDKAKTMGDTKEQIAPLKSQITGLLKKEADLRKIADAYTGAESDHAFWIDAVNELRGAFASDAVWLTDVVPLANHNPFAPPPADPTKAEISGQETVKADFATAAYGTSALTEIRTPVVAQQTTGKKGAPPPPPPKANTANALCIRGLWRENPKSQNLVNELLQRLKDSNSPHFSFKAKNPADGKEVELFDTLIKVRQINADNGEFALPFEIVIPLSREVIIK